MAVEAAQCIGGRLIVVKIDLLDRLNVSAHHQQLADSQSDCQHEGEWAQHEGAYGVNLTAGKR